MFVEGIFWYLTILVFLCNFWLFFVDSLHVCRWDIEWGQLKSSEGAESLRNSQHPLQQSTTHEITLKLLTI